MIRDEASKVRQVIALEEDAYPTVKRCVNADLSMFIKCLQERPELLQEDNLFNRYHPDPDEGLYQATYELLMKSWLLGMVHTSRKAKTEFADVDYSFLDQGMSFEEAVKWARGRVTLTSEQFAKLSDHMKMHAFTVSRLSQMDMLGKAHQLYVKQLNGSEASMQQFVSDIKADVDAVGLPGYYEMVYRTNIQKDYNAGRALEFQNDRPVALEFIGIEDSRQSDICRVRSGTILPYTDPWWDDNWPPLHYNCRSTVRAIYEEEAVATGLMDELESVKENSLHWVSTASAAQKGFGANPAKDNQFWAVSASQQKKIVRSLIQEEINEVAQKTVCKDFDRDIPGYERMQVGNGKIRYPKIMEGESEFQDNLAAAKLLAKNEGYCVELRVNPSTNIKGTDGGIIKKAAGAFRNKQFDAWLNGTEKWEFKSLTSKSIGRLGESLREASAQASSVFVRLERRSQITKFESAVINSVPELKLAGRRIKEIKVALDDRYVTLTWEDLEDPAKLKQRLTWLFAE